MSTPENRLYTVGEISRRTDRDIHRIEYVIRAYGIRPWAKAGNARVFADHDVERIIAELHRIDSARKREVAS
jgi:hypothetical protein